MAGDEVGDVVECITLGTVEVPPLPIPPPLIGEPCGVVISKGRTPHNNSDDPLNQLSNIN